MCRTQAKRLTETEMHLAALASQQRATRRALALQQAIERMRRVRLPCIWQGEARSQRYRNVSIALSRTYAVLAARTFRDPHFDMPAWADVSR